MSDQPQMRARIWVDGVLVVNEMIDFDNLHAAQQRHERIVDEAVRAGKVYCVEMSDDDDDIAPLRFGNDQNAMVEPRPYSDELLNELIDQRDPRRQP